MPFLLLSLFFACLHACLLPFLSSYFILFLQASLFKLSAFLLPFSLPSFYFFFLSCLFYWLLFYKLILFTSFLYFFSLSFSVPSLFLPWFLSLCSCIAFLTGYWLFLFEVCSYFLPSIYPSSLPSTSPSPLI